MFTKSVSMHARRAFQRLNFSGSGVAALASKSASSASAGGVPTKHALGSPSFKRLPKLFSLSSHVTKLHGNGIVEYSNGDVYEGWFVDGKMHGPGLLKYADGATLQGTFENDKIQFGTGTLRWPNKGVYTGEWSKGKMHGPGKLVKPDGSIIEGDFVEGKFSSGTTTAASAVPKESDSTALKPRRAKESAAPQNGSVPAAAPVDKRPAKMSIEGNKTKATKTSPASLAKHNNASAQTVAVQTDAKAAKPASSQSKAGKLSASPAAAVPGAPAATDKQRTTSEEVHTAKKEEKKKTAKRAVAPAAAVIDALAAEGTTVASPPTASKGHASKQGPSETAPKGVKPPTKQERAMQAWEGEYAGERLHGVRQGQGTLVSETYTYTGAWEQDVPCGQGSIQFKSGTTYAGEWRNGKYNGQGKLSRGDGSALEGVFRDGSIYTGAGQFFHHSGTWVEGKMQGQGRRSTGTCIYEGMYKDGKRHGPGVLTYINGGVLRGEFRDDKIYNGEGVFRGDTTVLTGKWVDGVFHGETVRRDTTPTSVKSGTSSASPADVVKSESV